MEDDHSSYYPAKIQNRATSYRALSSCKTNLPPRRPASSFRFISYRVCVDHKGEQTRGMNHGPLKCYSLSEASCLNFFFVQLKNKKWDNETKSTLLMISKWRSTHGLRSISAVFSGSVFQPLKHGREHLLISWTAISNRAYLWPYNFGYQLIIKLIT